MTFADAKLHDIYEFGGKLYRMVADVTGIGCTECSFYRITICDPIKTGDTTCYHKPCYFVEVGEEEPIKSKYRRIRL